MFRRNEKSTTRNRLAISTNAHGLAAEGMTGAAVGVGLPTTVESSVSSVSESSELVTAVFSNGPTWRGTTTIVTTAID